MLSDDVSALGLRRRIVAYSAAAALVICLTVAAVAIWPLYARLEQSTRDNLAHTLRLQVIAIEEVLARAQDVAMQFTSRTRMRQELARYNAGDIDLAQLKEFSTPKLADAVRLAPEVAGVTRLDRAGRAVLSVGLAIPESLWPLPPAGATGPVTAGPVRFGDELYLLLGAPISDREDLREGTDVVLFELDALRRIVGNYNGLGRTGETILAHVAGGKAESFFPLRHGGEDGFAATALGRLVAEGNGPGGRLASLARPDGGTDVAAWGRLRSQDWTVAVRMDRSELNAGINKLLAWILIASGGLMAAGLTGLMVVLRPLTGRMLIETGKLARQVHELRTLTRAVEQSPVSILVTDVEGRIEYVNPRFTEATGYSAAEVVGRSVNLVDDAPDSVDKGHALWTALLAGDEWHGEYHTRRKDGSRFWESVSVSPIKADDGTVTHFVGVKEDISRRKEAEEKLARTLDVYARSNAELERFAYVASHDLQEPVRVVVTYAQRLERECADCHDGRKREYLDFVIANARRAGDLVRDLLEYSRVTAQEEAFTDVDMTDALAAAWEGLAAAVTQSGARIVRGPLPRVSGNRAQLTQLFQALIHNAIKYRAPDRPPEIAVTAERGDGDWTFLVADNGIGIEAPYRERIFSVFSRLHPAGAYPGTGIGLAICKRIVERHGGRIWAEPRDGGGSVFRFTLPARPGTGHPS